jgi:hypothetical protein
MQPTKGLFSQIPAKSSSVISTMSPFTNYPQKTPRKYSNHICKKWPSASYQLNCPEKVIVEKKIKIILPTIHSCFTAMVCHNLRQAYLLEVGLTQIPT